MSTRIMVAIVLGMSACTALAQQPGGERAGSGPETKPSSKRLDYSMPLAAPGTTRAIASRPVNRPELSPTARMVLLRFVIAQVRLTADQAAAAKPAAAGGPENKATPPKSPILAMPAQSLFDPERLNKELQAAPLDLRSADRQLGQRLTRLLPDQTVEIITRGQLATLDGQPAFIQTGQREPRITAAQVTQHGRINAFTMDNLGMIASFVPRVHNEHRISLQADVEKTQLGPLEEGAVISELPGGEKVRSPQIQSMIVQTTMGVTPGQAVALAGVSTRADSRRTEFLVLVSAELLDP